MKLSSLLSILPFYQLTHDIDTINISSIKIDHRHIEPGDIFVCIKGFTVDGHDFASQAVENGAIAVVAERELDLGDTPVIIVSDTTRALALLATKYYQFPSKRLPLIGVTGTNGKTTVTYLVEAIFKAAKQKTGLIGTIQMKIGDDTYPVQNTTPNALVVQQSLSQMVDEQVDVAVMEVSSHALDLGRVHGCDYDIAVYTNLSQDHLDYHKNMADYLRAKSLLFSQLGNDYNEKQQKFAIINRDDEHYAAIEQSTGQHIITYGINNKADVMAENISLQISQTNFLLTTPIGSIEITSQLIGAFNVYNMLAAASVAIAMNVPLSTIKTAFESITGVNGRFEQVNAGQNYAVIVDYAHTPDSLENVLTTIKEFATKNIYVVVGCGGDRDRSKRPLMAEIATQYADLALFTTDNPRTEDPKDILADMTDGLTSTNYEVIVDRKEAIERAIHLAKEDDVILIAGKGHETYQEINHVRYDFDDRQVAKDAIIAKESD